MTSGRSRLLATLAGATLIPSLVSGLPTPDYASHQLDKRTPTMTATYFYSDDCTGNVLDTVPYPAGCYAPDYNFAGSMKWTLSGTNGDAQVLTYAQSGCVGDPVRRLPLIIL